MKSCVVFCGSSEGNDTEIIEQGYQLGAYLANNKIDLVYGAGKIGIMGKVAQGALENNGRVIGVIPEFLKLKEVVHLGLTELHVTNNMHERKLLMHDLSDSVITLPGGYGTLEELFEMVTWGQLGLHQKPMGILNTSGFYDDMLGLLENMVRKGFLKMSNFEMLIVDDNIERLIEKMNNYKPTEVPKWIKKELT